MALPQSTSTSTSTSTTGQAPAEGGADRFHPTSWTAVVHAGRRDTPEAREALERLCSTYLPPVQAYLRRLGFKEHDAMDLTQEFFRLLLERNLFGAADRRKGKFRSFLLTALRHFVTDEHKRAKAAKRGGGQAVASLDEPDEDQRLLHEPASNLSPVKLFEQQWARTVFQQAMARLKEDYEATGRIVLFTELHGFLENTTEQGSYGPLAERLGMTANGVGVAVYRLRQRFGDLLRAEITQTLANPTPAEVEAEVRHLFEALAAN